MQGRMETVASPGKRDVHAGPEFRLPKKRRQETLNRFLPLSLRRFLISPARKTVQSPEHSEACACTSSTCPYPSSCFPKWLRNASVLLPSESVVAFGFMDIIRTRASFVNIIPKDLQFAQYYVRIFRLTLEVWFKNAPAAYLTQATQPIPVEPNSGKRNRRTGGKHKTPVPSLRKKAMRTCQDRLEEPIP